MDRRAVQVRTVAANFTHPLDAIGRQPELTWLKGREGLVAWGAAARFDIGSGGDRFVQAADKLEAFFSGCSVEDEVGEFGTGPLAFAAFSFNPRSMRSAVVVPAVVAGVRGKRAWLTTIGSPELPTPSSPQTRPLSNDGRIRYAGSTISEVEWVEAVVAALRAIETGRVNKVVLARDLEVWSKSDFDPTTMALRLAARFPQCHTYVFDGLVGSSPELLIRRRGPDVESVALAGSAKRGTRTEEDDKLAAELLSSSKDLREHMPVVDSVRSVLDPICRYVEADQSPWIMKLENVQHLATRIRGRLDDELSALAIAGRLHPTAAVCGEPTDAALDLISQLEGLDRLRYSGPVGWVNAQGEGEFCIALRSGEFDGRRGRLFAGAGIVARSLPEQELEETRLKFRAMQSALQ